MNLCKNEELEWKVVDAIHDGDVETLKRLLREIPGLARAAIGDPSDRRPNAMSRASLHVATDWPGHFPNVAATIRVLVEAGADPNARFTGPHTETPLHWAASSDDVEALDALLDAGANIEANGAVIGGGTPLSDAVAFAQWNAARRLVERGARTQLWEAAALGMLERVEKQVTADRDGITPAFWCACHGGQRNTAEFLLDRGADVNWIGYDKLTPLDAARRSRANELVEWLRGRGAKSARELR
jgi:ankyrin repeat protein